MKFSILGADIETGSERSIVIEADDESQAIRNAKSNGLYPYKVEALAEQTGCDMGYKSRHGSLPVESIAWRQQRDALLIGVSALVLVVVVIGVIFLSSGTTRDSDQFERSRHAQETPPIRSTLSSQGKVDFSLVEVFRSKWREEGFRTRPRSEQVQAMLVMMAVIQTDIPNPADQEATSDYIQATIDSW